MPQRKSPVRAQSVHQGDQKNDLNLNISRTISTDKGEEEIDLQAVHKELVALETTIQEARDKHNAFLQELGLPLLP
jgi:type I restriction enzyme M protein